MCLCVCVCVCVCACACACACVCERLSVKAFIKKSKKILQRLTGSGFQRKLNVV